MRSQDEQQFLQIPLCPENHQAVLVCANKQCNQSAFICSVQYCRCRNHFCQAVNCTKFLYCISAQRLDLSQHEEGIKCILNIYDRMIKVLTQKRQQFLDSLYYLGLNDQAKQVAIKINNKQANSIRGKIVTKIIEQPVKLKSNFLFQNKNHYQSVALNMQQKLKVVTQSIEKQQSIWNKNVDSKIIMIIKDQQFLSNHFKSPNLKFKRIFRASDHSFQGLAFRNHCMGIPHILVLIKTNNSKIIGGYLHEGWTMNHYNSITSTLSYFEQFVQLSDKSFLFSITDEKIYPIVGNRIWKKVQIDRLLQKIQGPYFGSFSWNSSEMDLWISSRCDKQLKSFSNFPSQFESLQSNSQNFCNRHSFCGEKFQNTFYIKEYQVFRVSFD